MDAGYFTDRLTGRTTDLHLQAESFEEECILGAILAMIRDGGRMLVKSGSVKQTFAFTKTTMRVIDCGDSDDC